MAHLAFAFSLQNFISSVLRRLRLIVMRSVPGKFHGNLSAAFSTSPLMLFLRRQTIVVQLVRKPLVL